MFFKLIKTITVLSCSFVTIDNSFFCYYLGFKVSPLFFFTYLARNSSFLKIKHKIDFTIHINPESVEKKYS